MHTSTVIASINSLIRFAVEHICELFGLQYYKLAYLDGNLLTKCKQINPWQNECYSYGVMHILNIW